MVVDIEHQKNLWISMKPEIYKIAVIVGYSATANQLIQYIEDLNKYSTVNCIGVVLDNDMKSHQAWYKNNCQKVPLLCCSEQECQQLTMLDAIIIPESNVTIYEHIPSSIIKIGLPHGTDIPIESTLFSYGGGFYFDYILSAIKQPELIPEKYINGFPAAMRLHKKPFVCLLPFGFPKLDKFFDVVTKKQTPKKAIVYHLSLLSIEEPWVVGVVFDTLKELLDDFPNNKIIFRVHQLNQTDPIIIKCINMGRNYPNFYYSDADSYIEDYAEGAVMVTHREYYNHLFDLATACPTVLYKNDGNYLLHYEHDERYFLANNINFNKVLRLAINARFNTSIENRKKRCLAAGIFNPGSSLDYFVHHLDDIVKGRTLPQWTTYYFNDGSLEEIDIKLRQFILSTRPFGHFALAYGAMTHYSAKSLLLLAESFIRHHFIKEYFYPLGLKYFYQLVHHEHFCLVANEAEFWWTLKGKSALKFCFEAIDNGEISTTPELLWLQEHYKKGKLNISKANVQPHEELSIVNLHDGSHITSTDVILYGTGAFTEEIIAWNKRVNMFNPIIIIDDKPEEEGPFCGIPVLPTKQLKNYSQDIIICSPESLVGTFNALILKNNVDNKLYGIITETFNALLFSLIKDIKSL